MTAASGNWIVRLGRTRTPAATSVGCGDEQDRVLLAGEVVDAWSPDGMTFGCVEVRIAPRVRPLLLTTDVVEFRCRTRELPDDDLATDRAAPGEVVHLICSQFPDPDTIERFLEHTRDAPDRHISVLREAWLEVEEYPIASAGLDSTAPPIDDIFIARYRSLATWRERHALPLIVEGNAMLVAEAATLFDLVISPSINRIAEFR